MSSSNRTSRSKSEASTKLNNNNYIINKPTTTTTTATSSASLQQQNLLQDKGKQPSGGRKTSVTSASNGASSGSGSSGGSVGKRKIASRAISGQPKVLQQIANQSVDPKDAVLEELQREINELRSRLAKADQADSVGKQAKISLAEKQRVEQELSGLREKLAYLESKLVNSGNTDSGSTNADTLLLDQRLLQGYTKDQELALEKNRAELIDQRNREEVIRSELERQEEDELLAKKSFTSIQQEVDSKKALIKQILLKIQSIRNEIEIKQDAYRLELDELDQLQCVLQRELKLKCLILDNFIPNEHVDHLLTRIDYDERRNTCSLRPLDVAYMEDSASGVVGCCITEDSVLDFKNYWRPSEPSYTRPRSEFERIAATIYPTNIRYKYENVIEPKLEYPREWPKACIKANDWAGDTRGSNLGSSSTSTTRNSSSSSGNNKAPEAGHDDDFSARLNELLDAELNKREPDLVV